MELNHRNLCDIAVKWLKRPNSSAGHACHVAVSEVASYDEATGHVTLMADDGELWKGYDYQLEAIN